MQIQPTVVSNVLKILGVVFIATVVLIYLFSGRVKMPNNRDKEFIEIAAKQDSLLKAIKKQDTKLNILAVQTDSMRINEVKLLQRQTNILNNIKNLQNEYKVIEKLSYDRAAIYKFYIDSLKEYIRY